MAKCLEAIHQVSVKLEVDATIRNLSCLFVHMKVFIRIEESTMIQWPQHGEEILENTLQILRGWQYPLMSGGEADGQGGYCSTSKDEEGILQYLRAMLRPLTLL